MRGFPENLHRYSRLGRRSYSNRSNFTVGIKGKAHIRIQMIRVHRPCTKQSGFFTCCNHELNLAVWNLLLLNYADRFEQGSKSRFVIRAEYRSAVAGNPAVFAEGRFDIFPWNHCIHMTGEQQLRCCRTAVSRPGYEQITRSMSGTLLGIILDGCKA
ncbi:hypothetical protein D3C81_1586780 [compost metagenome]